MKNIQFTCDRCRKEILLDVYMVTIYAEPVATLAGKDCRQSMESACENIKQNLREPLHLCKTCRVKLGDWFMEDSEIAPPKKEDVNNAPGILPCKVGDTVYFIPLCNGKPYWGVRDGHVQSISISKEGIRIRIQEYHPDTSDLAFGETVFISRNAAKSKLKEIKERKNADKKLYDQS